MGEVLHAASEKQLQAAAVRCWKRLLVVSSGYSADFSRDISILARVT